MAAVVNRDLSVVFATLCADAHPQTAVLGSRPAVFWCEGCLRLSEILSANSRALGLKITVSWQPGSFRAAKTTYRELVSLRFLAPKGPQHVSPGQNQL